LTGELANAASAPNVTLVRVLSVPRMPGVVALPHLQRAPIAPGAPPATAESRVVDAPVEPEASDIPPGNRH